MTPVGIVKQMWSSLWRMEYFLWMQRLNTLWNNLSLTPSFFRSGGSFARVAQVGRPVRCQSLRWRCPRNWGQWMKRKDVFIPIELDLCFTISAGGWKNWSWHRGALWTGRLCWRNQLNTQQGITSFYQRQVSRDLYGLISIQEEKEDILICCKTVHSPYFSKSLSNRLSLGIIMTFVSDLSHSILS